MTDVMSTDDPLRRLAVPGERFGWIFRDRNLYRRRFLEPPPSPAPIRPELAQRADLARRQLPKRIWISLGIGVGLALTFGCCGGLGGEVGAVFMFFAVMSLAGGAAGAFGSWVIYNNARSSLGSEQRGTRQRYEQAYAEWDGRRQEFEGQQQAAIDQMLEWGAAVPSVGTRRIDLVGGTSWGWEAVLTVLGGSLLSTRGPMTLVDFTGEALCGELVQLAGATGAPVSITALPSELAELDLAAGLTSRELVDSLVESMHGDASGGNRAERHQDTMLLTELCDALGEKVTLARIVAGLRVLTDRPGQPALTAHECDRIADLLPDEARRQAHSHLRRIEGFLRPLEAMGSAATGRPPATLTCLIADRDGRNAQHDLLKDLILQWLIRQVSREAAPVGSMLVIGADEVNHRHIERLSTLCERRGVRLVLFFEHLRAESLHTLGGGEVGFMRLGNHQEAQQAAEFIGRQHRFVLSQLTRSLGGNETHTLGTTEGHSETEGVSLTRGGSTTSGGGRSSSGDGSSSWSRTRNWSRTRSWSRTQNWSQSESTATGSSWNDAASAQRVYEYAVEPRVLQDLPDYALLLVKGQGRGSVVQAVECDPAIITLPRMTMEPLPFLPLPEPHEAAIPVGGQPTELTVSQPAPIAPHQSSPGQAATGVLPGWGQPAPVAAQPAPPPHYQQPYPQPGYPPQSYPPPPQSYPPPPQQQPYPPPHPPGPGGSQQ